MSKFVRLEVPTEWDKIKVIVGLGNPGTKYRWNRHNVGFLLLDFLAEYFSINFIVNNNFMWADFSEFGLILVKPLTFMNNSGDIFSSLKKIVSFEFSNLLVVHDELEKEFGYLGFRFGGSAKGHNGLKSIISVKSDQFLRLRIGIGRPANKQDVPNYVLENFSKAQQLQLQDLFQEFVEFLQRQKV